MFVPNWLVEIPEKDLSICFNSQEEFINEDTECDNHNGLLTGWLAGYAACLPTCLPAV